LDVTRWPDDEDPLVIAHLRPAQLDAVGAGFACWTSDHLVIPWHARGVVERTAAGAALLIGGILIASGEADLSDPGWRDAVTCAVGVVPLGAISLNPFLIGAEFASMLHCGQAMLAEMALADRHPAWQPL
jgi:hypothetical protein